LQLLCGIRTRRTVTASGQSNGKTVYHQEKYAAKNCWHFTSHKPPILRIQIFFK
jgi:hypothetical protein